MDNTLKTKIAYEISQIDELIDKADVLVSLCKSKEPDFIEITAVGGILHSFYNGIENIFVLIGKSLHFDFSASSQWHRNLIDFMFAKTIFFQLICVHALANTWALGIFSVIHTATQLSGKNAPIFFWNCQIFGKASANQF